MVGRVRGQKGSPEGATKERERAREDERKTASETIAAREREGEL
jgi:hypothetical protein